MYYGKKKQAKNDLNE